jgi:hypothetical protein
MYKTLILLSLSVYTLAAPHTLIKKKLAQAEAKQIALDCSCSLPGTPGADFPGLASGQFNNFGSASSISQAAAV